VPYLVRVIAFTYSVSYYIQRKLCQ